MAIQHSVQVKVGINFGWKHYRRRLLGHERRQVKRLSGYPHKAGSGVPLEAGAASARTLRSEDEDAQASAEHDPEAIAGTRISHLSE